MTDKEYEDALKNSIRQRNGISSLLRPTSLRIKHGRFLLMPIGFARQGTNWLPSCATDIPNCVEQNGIASFSCSTVKRRMN